MLKVIRFSALRQLRFEDGPVPSRQAPGRGCGAFHRARGGQSEGMKWTFAVLIPAASLVLTCPAGARDFSVKDRTALVRALQEAKAGDVIKVAPGRYAGGLMVTGLQGVQGKPVVITAADRAQPPVIEGGASGIQLSGCQWVELSHLHFTGAEANGINIDDGGAGKPASRGMVLKSLTVQNSAPKGNRDGIKLSGVESFTISGCTVERWGAGGSAIDMVGCRQGVVEDCVLRHDGAAAPEANGVQMKGGSEAVKVVRCRFLGAGGRGVNLGGSTGAPYFRPPGAPFEARNLTVEDCLFVDVQAPVAFVGVDGAVVRHNTLIRPGRWALRILQENRGEGMARCRKGVFSHNVIVFQSGALREAVNIGPDTAPESFQFASNVWHCEDRPADTRRFVRLPVPEKDGRYDVAPAFLNPAAGNYFLKPGSPGGDAGMRAVNG